MPDLIEGEERDAGVCPVLATAQIVSGKWTLLLLRDLAAGPCRFTELQRSLEGISPRTLALRLRALEQEGVVERREYPESPPRVEYELTDRGADLLPIVEAMRSYGSRWLGCAAEEDLVGAAA